MHSHLRPAVIFGFNYEASCSAATHGIHSAQCTRLRCLPNYSTVWHYMQPRNSRRRREGRQGRSSWFYSHILTTHTLFTLSSNTG